MERKAKGFTFMELLITLAIAAIVIGIAIPSFTTLISSTRLYTHTRQLFNTLLMTRSRAITSGFRCILCPTLDGEVCHDDNKWHHRLILFEDRNGNGAREVDSEPLVYAAEAAKQLYIYSGSSFDASGARKKVSYYPAGHAYGSAITLTLCDKRRAAQPRLILQSNYGRPRISAKRADGSAPNCP